MPPSKRPTNSRTGSRRWRSPTRWPGCATRKTTIPSCASRTTHCVVRFSTHSAGGITRNDFICAAKARLPLSPSSADDPGRVISGHGRHVVVEAAGGERVLCHGRGRKSECVVGDLVRWQRSGDEGVVEETLTRPQPAVSAGRLEDEGVRRQHRPVAVRRRGRAGVQRVADGARANCRSGGRHCEPHRPEQAGPAVLRRRRAAPSALHRNGHRRAPDGASRGPGASARRPRAAAARPDDAGAWPERRRQEHPRQSDGERCQGPSR